MLRGRVDGLEVKVGELEATRFSPTTKLSGLATVVLGANSFGGSASDLVRRSNSDFGATSFNYDLQLSFDTSFTGKDLLRTILRSGNFDVDNFTLSLGGRVGQEDMLALWPSLYPAETVLDVLTLAGAPAACNKNLGAGAGLWWQKDGFSISANYVAANAADGDPDQGGVASAGAGGTGTVQIGYANGSFGLAAIYSAIQNANNLIVYATNFALESFSNPGNTSAFGLSGYWQPERSGWIPSISAGWGFNTTNYASDVDDTGLVASSQSWSVGLQWQDVFSKGHALGMAVGQPTFATRLHGGETPRDGNVAWEWWYKLQLTDNIAITPALFYLSRPLGADTPGREGFNQLGALIKTSFSF